MSLEKLWKSSPRFNRLACLDPDIKCNNYAKLLSGLHRDWASLLFQLRTGHVPLNAFLFKIPKSDSPICVNCWLHNETVLYYVLHCVAFNDARKTCFKKLEEIQEI